MNLGVGCTENQILILSLTWTIEVGSQVGQDLPNSWPQGSPSLQAFPNPPNNQFQLHNLILRLAKTFICVFFVFIVWIFFPI